MDRSILLFPCRPGAGTAAAAPAGAIAKDLAEAGFRLDEPADLDEALVLASEIEADLFLIEGDCPEAEGVVRLLAGNRSLAHVPILVAAGAGLGTLAARRLYAAGATEVSFPPHLKSLVAGKAEALVRLKRRIDVARELSVRDELTGLYNRRFFFERLDQEVARARRSGQGIALLMLDVDRFKKVNDTYGHPAGDLVLRRIAATTQRHTRKSDLAARMGGDELALLLSSNTLAGAKTCAVGLQRRLREARFDPAELRPTVSIGIAAYPGPQVVDPVRDLVRVADEALLRAKARGKNRIELADNDPAALHRPLLPAS